MNSVKLQLRKLALLALNHCLSFLYVILHLFLPKTKKVVTNYLDECGVEINGKNDFDPKVVDDRFYSLLLGNGLLGLTDAYVNGYFNCDNLKEFLDRLFLNPNNKYICFHPSIYLRNSITRYLYSQSEASVEELGKSYDEDTFHLNADEEECKNHSTGYWKHATTLQESWNEKCELVAKKLKLKPGMTVIDVGCGDGVLCNHLARNHGVSVVGVNISIEAIRKAAKNCRGLDVKYELKDCRRINGKYDRIVCIQLIELFGASDLKPFFEKMHQLLEDDGILFLEATTVNHDYFPSHTGLFEKYCNATLVFHYYLDILKSIEGLFVIEDLQNISIHATRTLSEELKEMKQHWKSLLTDSDEKSLKGSEAAFAFVTAAFTTRRIHPFQIVLSKNILKDGYDIVNDIN